MKINKFTSYAGALALAFLSVSNLNAQQLKVPAPSPTQSMKQDFALGSITIDYSRPGVKNRVIFGDVVPFGKIWRTGANATTKITFTDDVKLEGNAVAAGTYGVYTIPNKDSWEIMLYKDLTLGGNVADYKPENEVLRFKVKPTALATKVETFTIDIADMTSTAATIELMWDKTRVPISVTEEIDTRITKNIQSALAADTRPYFQAASYYYDTNKDQKQALEWANKAIEQNPKAFYMVMLKAKIEMKMGDKKAAVASANKTIELAKEAKNDDYVRMAEKLIADAK
ncbi:DUF2911 domain-containing protein [Taibaiella soli]|uniref:Uncharacterized protein n=1 Tax=Taibaiella soli TaxID=1649169 RepID=A0A2W2AVE7_9BACT|nr:DUF2911 domain-containing protein [Taibaiella soli]PZF71924.1 hypothetical protein DN068_17325 [Taibaiella soli]